MTTTIINALKIRYKQYDDYRFNNYINWCIKWAENNRLPLYHLVISKHLYSWYLTEWHNQVEKPFVAEIREFVLAEVEDPRAYLKLLELHPPKIDNNYPEQLLNLIQQDYEQKMPSKSTRGKAGLLTAVTNKPPKLPKNQTGD